MTAQDRMLAWISDHADGIVDLAGALIRTPSHMPDYGEAGVVQVLQSEAGALGLPQGDIIAAQPKRPNLRITLQGSHPGRHLVFNGHTDTKPAGDLSAWKDDPCTPRCEGGRLYGLGATDMKGSLAALLIAAAALKEAGLPEAGSLTLLFSADEEDSGTLGVAHVLEKTQFQADAALIAEPQGMHQPFETIPLASRGWFGFTLRTYGEAMHSSLSDQFPSVNAVLKMAWLLTRLAEELRLPFTPQELYPTGPGINLGASIHGGIASGVIPDLATCTSNIRTLPGMDHEAVRRALEDQLQRLQDEDPNLEVEFIPDSMSWPGTEIPQDHPLVECLQTAAGSILGETLPWGSLPGCTEAYAFDRHGIPCIPAFGPGLLPLAHTPNEFVEVDAMLKAAQIYALTAAQYLKGAR